jgi:hypothetical protein
MVFSSVPLYLDPPNWNNQQQQVTIFSLLYLLYGRWPGTQTDR